MTESPHPLIDRLTAGTNALRADRRSFMSKAAKLGVSGALASVVMSGPATATEQVTAMQVSDVDVLNFALSLEHLEATFYTEGLNEFSESDFEGRGSPGAETFDSGAPRHGTFQRLQEVRDHEQAHVNRLRSVIHDLGGQPVSAARYDFPLDDPFRFLVAGKRLEDAGVAAYAGAAPLIENEDVLSAALSIHSVEARHAAYLRQFPPARSPFPNAFDPALTMEEVIDFASRFIANE